MIIVGKWVRIKLIPQGYYARSWQTPVLVTLANIHEETYGYPVKCEGDSVRLQGSSRDICTSLAATLKTIIADTQTLISTLNLTAPRPGKNDKQVLQKTGIRLGDDTYMQVFIKVVNMVIKELESDECERHLKDLGVIELTGRGGIEYRLGEKAEYAPLQILKIEKHEYSKDFMNFTDIKGDLRTSKIWLAVLLAGWLRTYIGMGGGYLTFSMPPESMLEAVMCDPSSRRVFEETLGREPLGARGYYKAPARIKGSGKPLEALKILMALEALPYINLSRLLEAPPYRIVRVSYDGKTARLVDDMVIDLTQILMPIARMKAAEAIGRVDLLRYIRRLAECSILAYQGSYTGGCKDLFGGPSNAVSMVKILHQALSGALGKERAVYLLARLSPEPAPHADPPFKRFYIARTLLETL